MLFVQHMLISIQSLENTVQTLNLFQNFHNVVIHKARWFMSFSILYIHVYAMTYKNNLGNTPTVY